MLTIIDLWKYLCALYYFCFNAVKKKMISYSAAEKQSENSISNEPTIDLGFNDQQLAILPSKQIHFQGPYLRQNWSLPDSIIYYITKYPSNAKGYQKLIQSCKYFYAKNPILVIQSMYLDYATKKWEITMGNEKKLIEIENIPKTRFWVTDLLDNNIVGAPSDQISSIIPYLYQVDVTTLKLSKQILTLNEFLFLTSKIENIVLNECTVFKQDGSILCLEELVDLLPKIKSFQVIDNFSSIVTKDTVAQLLKIPHFSNILDFKLLDVSEEFDIEAFFAYYKKTTTMKLVLCFTDTSEAYKKRLEDIVDEIIEAKDHEYEIPYIVFAGITGTRYLKLCSLIYH